MNNAITTEEFEVTLLTDGDTTLSWAVISETPEQALVTAMGFADAGAGIYSVWDAKDPSGMPLNECTV